MKHSLQKAWRIPKLSGRRFASGKWVERNRRRIVYRVSLTVTFPRRRGSAVASLTELVASTVIVSAEQGLFRSHDGCCLCILPLKLPDVASKLPVGYMFRSLSNVKPVGEKVPSSHWH
jgi:hypothetical protein